MNDRRKPAGMAPLIATVFLAGMVDASVTGCGHVPREAVELNQAVGEGIAGEQAAYLNLFNAYFFLKKDKVDLWIQDTYIPRLMGNVREGMKAAGKKDVDEEGLREIVAAVVEQRDAMQMELEKTRLAVWERVTRDQVLLLNTNAQITALLQSMANVQEARQQMIQRTGQAATGGKFNFAEFDRVFDDYLKKAGEASSKGLSLIEKARPLLEGGK